MRHLPLAAHRRASGSARPFARSASRDFVEPGDLQREAENAEESLATEGLTDELIERRDREAARLKLEQGLAKIHPRYASAIRLRVIEERSREEVAGAAGHIDDHVRRGTSSGHVGAAQGDRTRGPWRRSIMKKSYDPPSRFGGERGPQDPDAPASDEELRAAARLRSALEAGDDLRGAHATRVQSPEMALVESLRAAASPRDLDPSRHQQILARALAPRQAQGALSGVRRNRKLGGAGRGVRIVHGPAQSPLAHEPLESRAQSAAGPTVAVSRSTTALFPDGIPATGGTSERVDRIAFARAQDLRENRFARWGVR